MSWEWASTLVLLAAIAIAMVVRQLRGRDDGRSSSWDSDGGDGD